MLFTVMLGGSVALPSCRCGVLSRLCSVLSSGGRFWPCRPFGLVIWAVAGSWCLFHSPTSGKGWGSICYLSAHDTSPRWWVMLLGLTWIRVGLVWRIGLGMLRWTLLLTWVGVTNLRRLWMPRGLCFRPGLIRNSIMLQRHRLWLRFPGFRLNLFLGHLVSCMGPVEVHGGCIPGADIAAWPDSVSLLCNLVFFLFLGLCIGLLMLGIWVTLVFHILEVLILF